MPKLSINSPSKIASFFEKNSWEMVMSMIALIIWTVTLFKQVEENSVHVQANEAKLGEIQVLVERIIKLEEHDITFKEDLEEIKQELKEIKVLVR